MSATAKYNQALQSPRLRNGTLHGHEGAVHRGLARDFRNRIMAVDEAAFNVAKRSFALAKQGYTASTPKPSYLISVQRSWSDMPVPGTLVSSISRDKKVLDIREVRLSASKIHADDWEDDSFEPGVSMSVLYLTINKAAVWFQVHEIAFLGLHSLARFYQRGGISCDEVTDAVLMAAIGRVFIEHKAILAVPSDRFRIAAMGGYWRGCVCDNSKPNRPGNILRVQTYSSEW